MEHTAGPHAPAPRDLTGPDWAADDVDARAYLRRLGVRPDARTDRATLEAVHAAHVHAFPFSNVDVLLRRHPGIDPATVSRRMLEEDRGGLCYEHVQLMAAGLEVLGFTVVRRLARVKTPWSGRTHAVLEVPLDGRRLLMDPGFGLSVTGPIELVDGAERPEPLGPYRVERRGKGPAAAWALLRGDELLHLTDELPALPRDLRAAATVVSTDPGAGPFLHGLVASRFTPEGHVTVTGAHRTVRRPGRATEREPLSPASAVAAVRELGVAVDDDAAAALEERLSSRPAR